MAYMNEPYRDACAIQKLLFARLKLTATKAFDMAQCVRGWIELERLKREMRGLPPLAPHKLDEIAKFKRQQAKIIESPSAAAYTEIDESDESKESLTEPTVTAPPDPKTP